MYKFTSMRQTATEHTADNVAVLLWARTYMGNMPSMERKSVRFICAVICPVSSPICNSRQHGLRSPQSWGLAQHYYIQPNTCHLTHMKQSQTPITLWQWHQEIQDSGDSTKGSIQINSGKVYSHTHTQSPKLIKKEVFNRHAHIHSEKQQQQKHADLLMLTVRMEIPCTGNSW